jgi:hypothetical protein
MQPLAPTTNAAYSKHDAGSREFVGDTDEYVIMIMV